MTTFTLNANPKPIYKRKTTTIKCDHCGVEFERRADSVNRRSLKNYCTPKCANTAKARLNIGKVMTYRRGPNLICKQCDTTYYVTPNRSNSKFCSRKCQGKYQQSIPLPKGFISGANNSGVNNGRYKDGGRVGTHTTKKKVRASVVERDGYWCLYCGKPGPGLHLHRVIYGSEGGKYEVNNCVQLCNIHHEIIHSNKRLWQPILIKFLSGTEGRKWFERYRLNKLLEATL